MLIQRVTVSDLNFVCCLIVAVIGNHGVFSDHRMVFPSDREAEVVLKRPPFFFTPVKAPKKVRGRVIFPDDPTISARNQESTAPIARLEIDSEGSEEFTTGVPSAAARSFRIRQLVGPCSWANKEVLYYSQCHKLLQLGTAACGLDAHNQWLVIDPTTWRPKCADFPCKAQELLYEDGKCHKLTEDTFEPTENDSSTFVAGESCGENEKIYFDLHGAGNCDCLPGAAFSPLTQSCHMAYSQGPCQFGDVFMPFDGTVACVPNPCQAEGEVLLSDGICYKLASRGPCPEDKIVFVDPKTLLPTCQSVIDIDDPSFDLENRGILRVPSAQARSSDSFKDAEDKCRYMGSKTQIQNDLCKALNQQYGFNLLDSSSIIGDMKSGDPMQCMQTRKGTLACPPGYSCNKKTGKCIKWSFRS